MTRSTGNRLVRRKQGVIEQMPSQRKAGKTLRIVLKIIGRNREIIRFFKTPVFFVRFNLRFFTGNGETTDQDQQNDFQEEGISHESP
ncbi:hypothetical protein D3C86_1397430 [compost metagenome]